MTRTTPTASPTPRRKAIAPSLRGGVAVASSSQGASDASVLHGDTARPLPPGQSKSRQLLAMLQRPEGASIDNLCQALGWLPHTVRAALSRLRGNGHAIVKHKQEGITCYRVDA